MESVTNFELLRLLLFVSVDYVDFKLIEPVDMHVHVQVHECKDKICIQKTTPHPSKFDVDSEEKNNLNFGQNS
jgi:hypothetical protein